MPQRSSTRTSSSTQNTMRLAMASMGIALVFLFTFLLKLPTAVGYIHLGDALILLYAAVTGDPLSMLVGAMGAGLADLASGYYQYLPATMLIKALVALPVFWTSRKERASGTQNKFPTKKLVLATLPSVPVTLIGYYVVDRLLFGAYAYAALWSNALQSVCSILLFVVFAKAMEKSIWKVRLF